jgi:hypothetical protein
MALEHQVLDHLGQSHDLFFVRQAGKILDRLAVYIATDSCAQ